MTIQEIDIIEITLLIENDMFIFNKILANISTFEAKK